MMWIILSFLVFHIGIRWIISTHGYSGAASPPMFGDYEAQRHWMELTLHVPISEWYKYDTNYWGLDYPPLTAYLSLLFGYIGSFFNTSWFELVKSRGYEDIYSKMFMRATVILTDTLFYTPSVILALNSLSDKLFSVNSLEAVVLVLLQPCLLLIDHGHFQYNHVMLGFCGFSIYFIHKKRYVLASIFYCCALNFKQMALYYSPVYFCFLLGVCFRHKLKGLTTLAKISISVILSIALPYIPFRGELLQVFQRIFPFHRGLYEDKVSNFWCVSSLIFKWSRLYDQKDLIQMSVILTAVCFLPCCLFVLFRPRRNSFLYALSLSSLSFFLFSFHVHEKSILLVTFPVSLLYSIDSGFCSWFIYVSCFSLFHLAKKDNLGIVYFALMLLWAVLSGEQAKGKKTMWPILFNFTTAIFVCYHIIEHYVPPPPKYQETFIMLNCLISFICFVFSYLYLTVHLIMSNK